MTDERIEQIQERLRLATQGPYSVYNPSGLPVREPGAECAFWEVIGDRAEGRWIAHVQDIGDSRANADLFANAPSDLTYLLAENERLSTERDEAWNERDRLWSQHEATLVDLARANNDRDAADETIIALGASRDALLTAANTTFLAIAHLAGYKRVHQRDIDNFPVSYAISADVYERVDAAARDLADAMTAIDGLTSAHTRAELAALVPSELAPSEGGE